MNDDTIVRLNKIWAISVTIVLSVLTICTAIYNSIGRLHEASRVEMIRAQKKSLSTHQNRSALGA